MSLDTVLHINYTNVKTQNYNGPTECKNKLSEEAFDPSEVHMYMDDNDVDALLVLSIGTNLVQYRLHKLP
jgi:hypothetical protein